MTETETQTEYSFRNWNGSAISHPRVVVAPANLEELRAAVVDADRYPTALRPIGNLHSLNACFVTSGTHLEMKNFNSIVVDRAAETVTVGAGVSLIRIRDALRPHGLRLEVTPEIGSATAGSVSCGGTKDASLKGGLAQVSSTVVGMRLVNANGEIEEVTEESDPERMKVLRSSYGLLGVIFEVTFRTHPAAVLEVDYEIISLDPVPPVERVLGDADGVLSFIDPYARRVIAERRTIAPEGAQISRFSRMKRRTRDKLWEQYSVFPMLMRNRGYAVTGFGTRGVMRGVSALGGYRAYRADSNIDFEHKRRHYFDFTFWAIPRSRWGEFVPSFFDFCDEFRSRTGFRYSLTTETYFMAQDGNALLSPAPTEPVFTMDPVDHRSTHPLWLRFNSELNELAADHGGRPYLNQTKELSKEVVHRTLGEDWQRFLEIREREDPDGRFLSDYFAELI